MYKIYTQQMYKIRTQQRHFQIKKSTNKKRYKIHAQQIYEIHTQQRHSKCTKSDTPNVQNPHTIEARNSFFYVHIVFSVTFEICMYNTYTYSYTYVYMRVHTPHTTESNIHVVWIHILLLHWNCVYYHVCYTAYISVYIYVSISCTEVYLVREKVVSELNVTKRALFFVKRAVFPVQKTNQRRFSRFSHLSETRFWHVRVKFDTLMSKNRDLSLDGSPSEFWHPAYRLWRPIWFCCTICCTMLNSGTLPMGFPKDGRNRRVSVFRL